MAAAAATVTGVRREYDVVLYGASGWTGQFAARYLVDNYLPWGAPVRWALGGRDRKKLEALLERLAREVPARAAEIRGVPLVVFDALGDYAAVLKAARETAVIASVAGPYAEFGEPVVRACVEAGSHYVDITGETPWIGEMIDRYDSEARAKGAFIVPSCGFDSVPSDLLSLVCVQALRAKGLRPGSVRAYLNSFASNNMPVTWDGPKPGGGTIASLLGFVEKGQLTAMSDPYFLVRGAPGSAAGELAKARSRKDAGKLPPLRPGYDGALQSRNRWTTHFLMAWINEKTVRRSAFLLKYGAEFSYAEGLAVGNPFFALVVAVLMWLLYAVLALPGGTRMLRRVLPQGSQTPPPRPAQYNPGHFEFVAVAESVPEPGQAPTRVHGTFFGPGDGGYTETSKMLLESALTLAFDLEAVKRSSGFAGGVLTPAVLGDKLVQRLRAKHMRIEVR
jgi:short subunit dehydrogenase-like uncharacterized protein